MAELVQVLRHAPDRRNPDAAREQDHVVCILHKRKIVTWRADGERLPHAQLLVHAARPAAACRIALDGDAVGFATRLRLEQ
jgi:hypothetical protein